MNVEYEIQNLKSRLDSLTEAFIQSQRNQVPITGKVDDTSNRVDAITPYTQMQTGYIGDEGLSFGNVPSGNLSIFVEPNCGFTFERSLDTVDVHFAEPLGEVTTVTISIQ